MVREMIEALVSAEPGMEIVGSFDLDATVASEVDRTNATVVVVADGERQVASVCNDLLAARSALKALAVIDDGGESFLCELRPYRVPLGVLSPERLLAILRAAPSSEPS
jgi:DNA-binding NarL/FixJ family response regulator